MPSLLADILPGMGTRLHSSSGAMIAEVCNSGTNYGANTTLYGNTTPQPCSSCLQYQVTSCENITDTAANAACQAALTAASNPATGGFTSAAACRFLPGYGLYNGVPSICPPGTYSAEGYSGPCSQCLGVSPASYSQKPGATSPEECSSCQNGLLLSQDSSMCGEWQCLASAPVLLNGQQCFFTACHAQPNHAFNQP